MTLSIPRPVTRDLGPTPESWRTCGDPIVPPLHKSQLKIKVGGKNARNDNLFGRIDSVRLLLRVRRERHTSRDRRTSRCRIPIYFCNLVAREDYKVRPRVRRDVAKVGVGPAAVTGIYSGRHKGHAYVRPVRRVQCMRKPHRNQAGDPSRELRELEGTVARVDSPARAVRVIVMCDRHRSSVRIRHRGEVFRLKNRIELSR
jgi:hypothetical protein